MKSILEKYASLSGPMIEALEVAVRQQNAEHLFQYAHKLKGSSASIGADRVASALKRMETSLSPVSWSHQEALFDELRREYRALIDEIDLMIAQPNGELLTE